MINYSKRLEKTQNALKFMIPEDFLNWKRITMVNKSKTPFFPISPCKRYPLGIWKIGNAASVTGLLKNFWDASRIEDVCMLYSETCSGLYSRISIYFVDGNKKRDGSAPPSSYFYFSVYLLRFLISSVFLFSPTAIKSILGD